MYLRLLCLILLVFFSLSLVAEEIVILTNKDLNKRWTKLTRDSHLNIKILLQHLKRSKTGRQLVELAQKKARSMGKNLLQVVVEGESSLTDTTLTRKFSAHNPEDVIYETQSVVTLNRELSVLDASLDLAHELTHFIYREAFNPYDKNYTLKNFISSTVEGKGGEVDAFVMECRVLTELYPSRLQQNYNCHSIYDPEKERFSRKMAITRFYQLGEYEKVFQDLVAVLGVDPESFAEVSSKKVQFVSSAHGLPYPLAAIQEFRSVVHKVCQNDQKRLGYYKKKIDRSPASTRDNSDGQMRAYKNFVANYRQRCGGNS